MPNNTREDCCEKCHGYTTKAGTNYFPLCNRKDCPCHTPKEEGWEKKFDNTWGDFKHARGRSYLGSLSREKVKVIDYGGLKAFIRSLLTKEREAVRMETAQKIGMAAALGDFAITELTDEKEWAKAATSIREGAYEQATNDIENEEWEKARGF